MSDTPSGPDLSHPLLAHFYRAVVSHMDVWRQRMDATTNWAAATTAGMVTFTFSTVNAPHAVLLLTFGFNCMFLMMESRRYQIYDLWRRRFRLLNRHLIAPTLRTQPQLDAEQKEALDRVAGDLGSMVPHLPLRHAIGYRVRRNYGYIFAITLASWLLKLEIHPTPAPGWQDLVGRIAIGGIPPVAVLVVLAASVATLVLLAIRAPSEHMINWADVPSPLQRWMSASRSWRGADARSRRPDDTTTP